MSTRYRRGYKKEVLLTVGGTTYYGGPDNGESCSPDSFPGKNLAMMGEDAARRIKDSDHYYNWGGVCVGLCHLLAHRKILYDLEWVKKCPEDWRPILAKYAILGVINGD